MASNKTNSISSLGREARYSFKSGFDDISRNTEIDQESIENISIDIRELKPSLNKIDGKLEDLLLNQNIMRRDINKILFLANEIKENIDRPTAGKSSKETVIINNYYNGKDDGNNIKRDRKSPQQNNKQDRSPSPISRKMILGKAGMAGLSAINTMRAATDNIEPLTPYAKEQEEYWAPWNRAIEGAIVGGLSGSVAGPWGALAGGIIGGGYSLYNDYNSGAFSEKNQNKSSISALVGPNTYTDKTSPIEMQMRDEEKQRTLQSQDSILKTKNFILNASGDAKFESGLGKEMSFKGTDIKFDAEKIIFNAKQIVQQIAGGIANPPNNSSSSQQSIPNGGLDENGNPAYSIAGIPIPSVGQMLGGISNPFGWIVGADTSVNGTHQNNQPKKPSISGTNNDVPDYSGGKQSGIPAPNSAEEQAEREVMAKARQKAIDEVNNDPKLKAFLFGAMKKEDWNDPSKPMEALFNRAAATGKSVKELLNNGFYGPVNRGEVSPLKEDSPDYKKAQEAFDQVSAGSNKIRGRTDQGMINEHEWADNEAKGGRDGGKIKVGTDYYSYGSSEQRSWSYRQQEAIRKRTEELNSQGWKPDDKNVPFNGQSNVEQNQKNADRRLPISDELKNQLEYAGAQSGIKAEVFSGGQDEEAVRRLREKGYDPSTRHDHGGSADLKLKIQDKDGKTRYLDMRNPDDQKLMAKYIEDSVAAGATGVGGGVSYMGAESLHIGGGNPNTWGGVKGEKTPQWLRDAWERGMKRQKEDPTLLKDWMKEKQKDEWPEKDSPIIKFGEPKEEMPNQGKELIDRSEKTNQKNNLQPPEPKQEQNNQSIPNQTNRNSASDNRTAPNISLSDNGVHPSFIGTLNADKANPPIIKNAGQYSNGLDRSDVPRMA